MLWLPSHVSRSSHKTVHRACAIPALRGCLYLEAFESIWANGGHSSVQQRLRPHLQPVGRHRTGSPCSGETGLDHNAAQLQCCQRTPDPGAFALQHRLTSEAGQHVYSLPAHASPVLWRDTRHLLSPAQGSQSHCQLGHPAARLTLCSAAHSIDTPGGCAVAARAHANRAHQCPLATNKRTQPACINSPSTCVQHVGVADAQDAAAIPQVCEAQPALGT